MNAVTTITLSLNDDTLTSVTVPIAALALGLDLLAAQLRLFAECVREMSGAAS